MAGIGEFFRNLTGGDPPTTVLPPAPPLASYPTPADAAEARKYGFGYGTGNEPYIQGDNARVVGYDQVTRYDTTSTGKGKNKRDVLTPVKSFVPEAATGLDTEQAASLANSDETSRSLDLTDPKNAAVQQDMGTMMAQAALAANRVPAAHLGFDPSRAAIDTQIKNPTVGGLYSPDDDSMYVARTNPSSLVHESAHRGIKQLKADPALAALFKKLPSEELIVRYLMATQAGDPEKGSGPVADQQRASAMYVLGQSGMYKRELEQLNRAAEDAYARRRPGGPR
jgi:hypothetical protein